VEELSGPIVSMPSTVLGRAGQERIGIGRKNQSKDIAAAVESPSADVTNGTTVVPPAEQQPTDGEGKVNYEQGDRACARAPGCRRQRA
jgi:hypothetical protein